MTSKIKRLTIHQENLKVTDINDFVSKQSKTHPVQNPFRGIFVFKVILVMMFGLIFQNFGIFVVATKAQMGENYSQPACQEFLEPTNPSELKQLRECAKQQREARDKGRKEEIKVLRTASASFLSESLGGPAGEIMPAANPDDINASATNQ